MCVRARVAYRFHFVIKVLHSFQRNSFSIQLLFLFLPSVKYVLQHVAVATTIVNVPQAQRQSKQSKGQAEVQNYPDTL